VPAYAAETRAAATQDGWWSRLQGPQEGEPDANPIRTLVPALPKPPNVPADAIATSATAGQVDKVAAVGIEVSLADDATLDALVLRLKEAEGSGANVGADKAKVIACPATGPWGPGQNAAWRDRPVADCSLGSAEGTRAEDGTWVFDLGAIGRLWTDPSAPVPAYGVVLSVDPAASPSSVQVSWLNFDTGSVAVELTATPGTDGAPDTGPVMTAPAAAAPPAAATEPSIDSAAGGPASGFTDGGPTGSQDYTSPVADVFTPGADSASSGAVPESPREAPLAAAPAGPAPMLQARPAVDFWEHVPTPTALLIPVTAGLAALVSVTLGPAGRPSPVFRREGGLTRALARRSPGPADSA